MKNNVEYVKRNMITVNTGGGCMVDVYSERENNILRFITVNEDGIVYYTVFMDEYEKALKENKNMLEFNFGYELEKTEDLEQLFWIAIDQYPEFQEAIRYDIFEEHEGLELYMSEEEREDLDEGVYIDYFNFKSSVREKICKDLMEIYRCR